MNSTGDALKVVCAWPVSGQYGPGSRVLYYVLVAASVFARKEKWLRGACLAAALLFPAVAALHAIVLAATNVDSAVDMDIYGAFQLCSIGILAAPATVKLSSTYFNDPGRNIIFVWTILVLSGLLSLTVQFYRSNTSNCTQGNSGRPITSLNDFVYGETMCGLTCSVQDGPFSPIRGGSANNIYVIPAPEKFSFGTGTLLAAACCIPAILSLVTMWNKILEINWRSRFDRDPEKQLHEHIEGTNDATVAKMRAINERIARFLSVVEAPIFGSAVLAILIIGERNLWSHPVRYQTEPIASIGQWAPIVGTGLAALGSLYLVMTKGETIGGSSSPKPLGHHCNCSHDHHHDRQHTPSVYDSGGVILPDKRSTQHIEGDEPTHLPQGNHSEMQEVGPSRITPDSRSNTFPGASEVGNGISRQMTATTVLTSGAEMSRAETVDVGGRRKVANGLTRISTFLGTAAPDRYNDEFRQGKARDFPEIPGEENRNPNLPQIRSTYNHPRDTNGMVTPAHRSRAGSFRSVERNSTSSRPESLDLRESMDSPTPTSPTSMPQRPHASTLPGGQHSSEPQNTTLSSPIGGRPHVRRSTLEVPVPAHMRPSWHAAASSSSAPITVSPAGEDSPAIMISPEPFTSSPTDLQMSNPPTPLSPSTPLPPPVTSPPRPR